MKRRVPAILMALLLVAGLCVLLYPTASSWINARNQTRAIQTYTEMVDELDTEELEAQWALARAYNQRYAAQPTDSFDQREVPLEYGNVLNLGGTGVMGYIEIPAIDVNLPVYHGTGETVLQRGVGHVPETALPVGGDGCHAVLTGHRGVATADLFTDLDKIAQGDVFLLHILGETLAYQVDQITVVEPDNIEDLLPVAGEDYVSLVTCTPYAVNSHRLLIRGTRTEYIPDEQMQVREVERGAVNVQTMVICAFALLWGIILFGFYLPGKRHKPYNQKKHSALAMVLIILLLLGGVAVILYPTIGRWIYRQQADQVIEEFDRQREKYNTEETNPLLQKIQAYNRWLYESGQEEGLRDPFAFEQSNSDLQELGYTEELFGTITIEKLELRLPVYLGGSQQNLNRGAAHMTHTSIPVGGENTNACVIGHRNLSRAEMFRNIDLLEAGDVVVFSNQWEDLEYRVVATEVIWPEEAERLMIQSGRDLLTLVSCYPKGSNTQRILVYCERKDG